MAARTRSRKAWPSYINRPKAQNASGVFILFLFNTDFADMSDDVRVGVYHSTSWKSSLCTPRMATA